VCIDIGTEVPVPLSAFCKRISEPKRPVSYEAIRGWWRQGRKSSAGRIVRLETIKMPYGRCTSNEAYQRFVERLNDGEE